MSKTDPRFTGWDRFTMSLFPRWTLNRVRARAVAATLARSYDAAQGGRRTSGWQRNRGDANSTIGLALSELRTHARDLLRNNAWARRGQRVIANNTVGWGIVPRVFSGTPDSATAARLWREWADSTQCDAAGRLTFSGIQRMMMNATVSDGEGLIRFRYRSVGEGLAIPLQLQVLESDFLDTARDGVQGKFGPIIQGVELDALGRRAGYWLFPEHPGSALASKQSVFVPASEMLHVFHPDRPGQSRGVSWLASAIVSLKDLQDFEDAELMKQKIAACFGAFVTDDGSGGTILGAESDDGPLVETLEPGMIQRLPPGKNVAFATPPNPAEGTFAMRNLRKVAAGLGVTYEDLTGDYSQVNFSSARMARISHWGSVRDWQWNMLVPLLCRGVWDRAMQAAVVTGQLRKAPGADWTCPPMPMIEPDREGLAYSRLVRNGVMTHNEMIREQGGDPDTHWDEYAEGLGVLDERGIKLDSDVRAVSQAGLTQERVGGGGSEGED